MNWDVLVYRIDSTDTIVNVSDNWYTFAGANACKDLHPEDVMGHKLWDFIQGLGTQYLYHELYRRVREGIPLRPIPFRCDSPCERRYLELIIEGLPDGQIDTTSKPLRSEPRSPVKLLDMAAPRSTEFVTVCSVCKKMEVSPGQWAEIEEGLTHLRLFEADVMPQLTHGLCRSCFKTALADLEKNTSDKGKPARTASYPGGI